MPNGNCRTTTPFGDCYVAHLCICRDFIFLDLVMATSRAKEDLGRVVIELYNDMIPVGTNHLR
jgi:hypothetical protein